MPKRTFFARRATVWWVTGTSSCPPSWRRSVVCTRVHGDRTAFELCVARYIHCKGAALAHRAGDRHLPAMHLRDVLHDSESETCTAALAAACLIDTVKTLKDTIEVVVWNADPLITHVDDQHIVVLACAHPDVTVRIAIGNGILEQVDDGLLEEWSVDRRA